MTVLSTTPPYSQYTGTGSQTYFEYGFDFTPDTQVIVEVDGVPVTFTSQANGVVLDTAPALGANIVIFRKTDITQETDFQAYDAFTGAKTEDAMDKLILLKQEAALFRAAMNLSTRQPVEGVWIDNSSGSDAFVQLWDGFSGMFAGEVTAQMPAAGAVVDKPKDFVYFQYGDVEILTQTLTTTLYPLESEDAIQTSMDITAFSMDTVSEEEVEFSQGLVSAFMEIVLIDDGPYDEEVDFSQGLVAVEMLDILLSDGPYDDEVQFSQGLVAVEMLDKLVSAYSPEEGIEIGMDITTFNMTPV